MCEFAFLTVGLTPLRTRKARNKICERERQRSHTKNHLFIIPNTETHRPTTMCRAIALLAPFLVCADAFVLKPQTKASTRIAPSMFALYDKEGHHITINPMDGFKGVDMERARVCAEHFGECTVEEMEALKSSKCVQGQPIVDCDPQNGTHCLVLT